MAGHKKPEVERRGDILAAAYSVVSGVGLKAMTVRTVASAADVSPGLIFFHFRSKDGLLLALLEELLDRTLDADESTVASSLSPWNHVYEMVKTEIDGLIPQRSAVELLFQFFFARTDNFFRTPIEVALVKYRAAFLPACRAAAGSADGDDLADAVLAVIQGAAVHVVRDPDGFDPDGILRALRRFEPSGK